jgi:hypothetical protein
MLTLLSMISNGHSAMLELCRLDQHNNIMLRLKEQSMNMKAKITF